MRNLSELLAQHGLLLVFANVLLTQVGIPLPAVPILVVAGALAAQGEFTYTALLLTAIAAALLGDTPWFFARRRYGHRVLRTLCRIAIEPDSCVKQTESIFERWGAPALLFAKYIPGFATVAPPLAGAMQLGLRPFVLFSAVGALLWVALPVALGARTSGGSGFRRFIVDCRCDHRLRRHQGRGTLPVPAHAAHGAGYG